MSNTAAEFRQLQKAKKRAHRCTMGIVYGCESMAVWVAALIVANTVFPNTGTQVALNAVGGIMLFLSALFTGVWLVTCYEQRPRDPWRMRDDAQEAYDAACDRVSL